MSERLTPEQIDALTGEALDLALAEAMEPRPEAVPARWLRIQVNDWRYSDCPFYSHEHWWAAQIGTSHGPDADALVTWQPAREPSENIADAWMVVERLKQDRWGFTLEWQLGHGWIASVESGNGN